MGSHHAGRSIDQNDHPNVTTSIKQRVCLYSKDRNQAYLILYLTYKPNQKFFSLVLDRVGMSYKLSGFFWVFFSSIPLLGKCRLQMYMFWWPLLLVKKVGGTQHSHENRSRKDMLKCRHLLWWQLLTVGLCHILECIPMNSFCVSGDRKCRESFKLGHKIIHLTGSNVCFCTLNLLRGHSGHAEWLIMTFIFYIWPPQYESLWLPVSSTSAWPKGWWLMGDFSNVSGSIYTEQLICAKRLQAFFTDICVGLVFRTGFLADQESILADH